MSMEHISGSNKRGGTLESENKNYHYRGYPYKGGHHSEQIGVGSPHNLM